MMPLSYSLLLPESRLKLLHLLIVVQLEAQVRSPHRYGGGAPNATAERFLPAVAVVVELVVPLSLLVFNATLMVAALGTTKVASSSLVLHWLLHGRHLLLAWLELSPLGVRRHHVLG